MSYNDYDEVHHNDLGFIRPVEVSLELEDLPDTHTKVERHIARLEAKVVGQADTINSVCKTNEELFDKISRYQVTITTLQQAIVESYDDNEKPKMLMLKEHPAEVKVITKGL